MLRTGTPTVLEKITEVKAYHCLRQNGGIEIEVTLLVAPEST